MKRNLSICRKCELLKVNLGPPPCENWRQLKKIPDSVYCDAPYPPTSKQENRSGYLNFEDRDLPTCCKYKLEQIVLGESNNNFLIKLFNKLRGKKE